MASPSAEIKNNLDGLKTARRVYSFIQFVVNYH